MKNFLMKVVLMTLYFTGGSSPTLRARTACDHPLLWNSHGQGGRAEARAAAHARIELHHHIHAAWVLPCRICGMSALWRMLNREGTERPSTSPASTTRRVLPSRASFRRLATSRRAPLVLAVRGLASPSRVKRQTSVVSTANCAPFLRKSIHHDLEPSCIELVHHSKIQVLDEDVSSHRSTFLSADSCSRILEREPSASQRPNNSTGRPMILAQAISCSTFALRERAGNCFRENDHQCAWVVADGSPSTLQQGGCRSSEGSARKQSVRLFSTVD